MLHDNADGAEFAPDHDPADAGQWAADARDALIFLTRLPLAGAHEAPTPARLAGAMRAFPIAGLAVGAIVAAVLLLASGLGAAPLLAALIAVAAGVVATGALHEDGLADVADGFGGGDSQERKLAIMRDSRTGSYGVLALIFAVGLKVTAIASLAAGGAGLAVSTVIAAAALSRVAPAGILHRLAPARRDGLSVEAGRPGRSTVLQGAGVATAVSVIVMLAHSVLVGLVLLPLAGLAAALATASLAKHQIGGQTGDVAGASQIVSEVAILFAAALALGH